MFNFHAYFRIFTGTFFHAHFDFSGKGLRFSHRKKNIGADPTKLLGLTFSPIFATVMTVNNIYHIILTIKASAALLNEN